VQNNVPALVFNEASNGAMSTQIGISRHTGMYASGCHIQGNRDGISREKSLDQTPHLLTANLAVDSIDFENCFSPTYRKGEAVMSQISSHYLAQLLDQIGVTYEFNHIENTITITVGDDHDHQFAVNLSLDQSGGVVWFSSNPLQVTGASERAYQAVMKRLLEINSSLDLPARVGLHPDGEMMVMMGLPILTPFGLPAAEAFRKLLFEFVAVVEELEDLVQGMASPFRGIFERRSNDLVPERIRKLMEMRRSSVLRSC
jgi:hypothetical protein